MKIGFINPSFEDGHKDHHEHPQRIQQPNGYFLRIYNDLTNQHKPDKPYGVPEMRVLPKRLVPAHEHVDFYRNGTHTLKIFLDGEAWMAGIGQVLDLPAGEFIAKIPVFCDNVVRYVNGGKEFGGGGFIRFFYSRPRRTAHRFQV